jgi:hypothetical protein
MKVGSLERIWSGHFFFRLYQSPYIFYRETINIAEILIILSNICVIRLCVLAKMVEQQIYLFLPTDLFFRRF